MINHACAHLEDRLFKCRHCDCWSSTIGNIRNHIRRAHEIEPAANNDFENNTVDCFDDMSKRIERCFSLNFSRASIHHRQFLIAGSRRNKSHRSVADLCRSIFIQRSKPSSFECNLCGLRISFAQGERKRFDASAMYEHAAAHLDVKLFKCLHCEHSMSSKCAMRRHLRRTHQITAGNSDNFDDQSEIFRVEHLNVIERCFSADHVKLEVPSATKNKCSIRADAATRGKTTGSKLTVERHIFCNRLIRTTVDSGGKIQCSLCSKRLAVVFSGCTTSQYVVSHAENHLQKPLYRCKVCGRSLNTQPQIADHLKRKHALGMTKNYECFSDEYHEELLAILTKCYDADGSRTT